MAPSSQPLVLLDTDVVVEVQRGQPKALQWLSTFNAPLTLPAIVALELLIGSRNGIELRRSEKFLANFDVEPLGSQDSSLAQTLVARHRLRTGLSLGDFLIAAQALNREAILLSFNAKHFKAIPNLNTQEPYSR